MVLNTANTFWPLVLCSISVPPLPQAGLAYPPAEGVGHKQDDEVYDGIEQVYGGGVGVV